MKKKFFVLTATLLLTISCIFIYSSLLSCSGSEKKVTIRFWNGFTGPDGRTILKIVKKFNQENPDVKVLMQRLAWATYYNKLFVAGLGEREPEIFVIHNANLVRFMQADFIRPVDDVIIGAGGIDPNDFDENIWQGVERNGKHYAIPLDIHPLGMYYNKKLFREAGLVDQAGEPVIPTNREEFLHTLRELTKDFDGDGINDQWGMVFTWFRTNVYTMMRQWGGELFNEDGTVCLLNSSENVEALQFCVDLIHKYKVAPSPENFESWIGFRQGKVGLAFEGIYMLPDLIRQTDLEYGGAPLPNIGGTKAAWTGSHILCLSARLEGARLDAAARFVKYLSDNSLDWAEGGQVPVRKSLRASERFKKMEIQSQFAKQIPYVRFAPKIPFIFEFYSEFDLAVEKALRGTLSPKEALDQATVRINEVIARRQELKQKEEK